MNVDPKYVGVVAVFLGVLLALTALFTLWMIAGALADGPARIVVTVGLTILVALGVLA